MRLRKPNRLRRPRRLKPADATANVTRWSWKRPYRRYEREQQELRELPKD